MILAAGLTPAWQGILRFEMLGIGAVNRADEVHWCASGKVLNVGKALHAVGAESRTLSVVGGHSGLAIRDDFAARGISARWVICAEQTRVCTTILESASRRATELVENAAALTAAELDAFRDAYREESQHASMVVLSGSLPPETPENFYRELLEETSAPVILDARGPELTAALAARPFLVKPNREELERTVGRVLRDELAVWSAMRELASHGAAWVAVTDGARPMLVTDGDHRWRVTPPVCSVVNPIGSGDSLAAATAWALGQGAGMLEALRIGVAAAADNVTRMLPAELDPAAIGKLSPSVSVEEL